MEAPEAIRDPDAWRGLVVLASANNWDGNAMADQHMARALTEHAPVLFVDPPISHLSPRHYPELRPSLDGPRLRVVEPRLARLTTVVQPLPSRPGSTALASSLVRWQVRRALRSLGGDAAAVLSAWPLYDLLPSIDTAVRAYWAQDDFVGGAALLGMSPRHVAARERRVSRAADLVIAANPEIAAHWRSRGHHVELIPYGCDAAAFALCDDAPSPDDVALPAPVAGFVGHINERIDVGLLEAVVDRGVSLLLVGPRFGTEPAPRLDALLRRPNVTWVGAKPFALLPSYHGLIDVGLVPYADSAFNRGSFPLKTLEYLAAGRPVVATDLPATRWLDTDLIQIRTDPASFADAVCDAVASRPDPELVARRRCFARAHSWTERATAVAGVLGLGQRASGDHPPTSDLAAARAAR